MDPCSSPHTTRETKKLPLSYSFRHFLLTISNCMAWALGFGVYGFGFKVEGLAGALFSRRI